MPYIIGNWKMHFTLAESTRLAADISDGISGTQSIVVLCPPFTSLYAVRDVLEGSSISLGAQDVFYEPEGAFTGEVSAGMLVDTGCKYVIIGHSERRQLGENNEEIKKKLLSANESGLIPILCVGESLADRKAGTGEEYVQSQLRTVLKGLNFKNLLIAYEPIWAIGTGEVADNEVVVHMLEAIKKTLSELGLSVPILYGGSVSAENVVSFVRSGFEGILVGTNSLKSESFIEIIKALE